jgi:hypothetical protein
MDRALSGGLVNPRGEDLAACFSNAFTSAWNAAGWSSMMKW